MEWWGPSRTIEQFDHEDKLLIRVTSLQRKGDYLLVGTGTFVAALVGLANNSWSASVGALCLGIVFAWMTSIERVSELLVTNAGVEWQNTGWWSEKRSLRWEDMFSLRYESGGEDGPTGLCAHTSRWASMCVVSNVSRAESDEISRMIHTKFPSIDMASEPKGFLASFIKAFRGET